MDYAMFKHGTNHLFKLLGLIWALSLNQCMLIVANMGNVSQHLPLNE